MLFTQFVTEIAQFSSLSKVQIYHDLSSLSCWNIDANSDNSFVLADIMKCWVPTMLVSCLQKIGLNSGVTEGVICCVFSVFMDSLFDHIWRIRCQLLINKELFLGISAKYKRNRHINYRNASNPTFPLAVYQRDSSLQCTSRTLDRASLWLSLSIRYGGNWLDF